jgi:hypothetical protein
MQYTPTSQDLENWRFYQLGGAVELNFFSEKSSAMKWVHSTLLVKLNEHLAKKSVFLPYINFAVVSEYYEPF